MLTIYMVRHGESVYGAEGRIQGDMDAPLSAAGRQQAAAVAERLRTEVGQGAIVVGLYCSPLRRASETASIIANWLEGLVPCPLPGLREMSLGDWQGKTPDELRLVSTAFDDWRRNPLGSTPPNGETFAEVQARSLAAMAQVAHAHAAQHGTVVVVAEGGPISLVLGQIQQVSLLEALRIRLDHAGISVLAIEGSEGRCIVANDTTHLAHLVPPAPLQARTAFGQGEDDEDS